MNYEADPLVPECEAILRSPERVAYHEAGHAVAWFEAGLNVRRVSIEPDQSGEVVSLGHVRLAREIALPTTAPVFDRAAIRRWKKRLFRDLEFVCAGSAADAIKYPELDDFGARRFISGGGDGSDADVALDLARRLAVVQSRPKPPEEVDIFQIVSDALSSIKARLERWENWFQVIALADVLMDRRSIDGREAKLICGRARHEYLDWQVSCRPALLEFGRRGVLPIDKPLVSNDNAV